MTKKQKVKVVELKSSVDKTLTNEVTSVVKTRLQDLQELYEVLKREGITSISKLEVMISQLQK